VFFLKAIKEHIKVSLQIIAVSLADSLAVNTKAMRQADCIRVEVSSLVTGTRASIMATSYHNVANIVAINTLAKLLEHNVIQVAQEW
jgi:hypothetical protein